MGLAEKYKEIADNNKDKLLESKRLESIKIMSLMKDKYMSEVIPEIEKLAQNGHREYRLHVRNYEQWRSYLELLRNDMFKVRSTIYGLLISW